MKTRLLINRHDATIAIRKAFDGACAVRYWRWLLGVWFLLFALTCASVRLVLAQEPSEEGVINREYPLKALFLFNFGSYVEWPADAFSSVQAPFVIGVLGSGPLEKALKDLAAIKTIAGRKIVVEQFTSVEGIRPCQILFVTRSVSQQQQRVVLEKLRDQKVLIVGESKDFAGLGGSVNFFIEANKVRFEINPESAKQHQLRISSKLLSLAKIVGNN